MTDDTKATNVETGEVVTISGTHPAADAWPMLDEPDLRRLAADIAANGQRHPIAVTPDGLILDGRNRHAACRMAEAMPLVVVVDTDDPAAVVLSENNERRHLSLPQRAAATALTLGPERRSNGRWQRGSVSADNAESRISHTWAQAMRQAGTVLDWSPDLLPAVAAGETALDAAHNDATAARRAHEQLTELPDDIRALVDSGSLTIADALRRAALPDTYRERIGAGDITLDEAEELHTVDQQRQKEREADAVDRFTRLASAFMLIGLDFGHQSNPLAEYNPDDERYDLRTRDAFTRDNIDAATKALANIRKELPA